MAVYPFLAIPHICRFLYTAVSFTYRKSTPKMREFAKKIGQNEPRFCVLHAKKYTSSRKSTPPPVVAVVTNMSYVPGQTRHPPPKGKQYFLYLLLLPRTMITLLPVPRQQTKHWSLRYHGHRRSRII